MTPRDAERALDEAYFAITTQRDREILPDPDTPRLIESGWTPESYEQIAGWAAHGQAIGQPHSLGRIGDAEGMLFRLIESGWDTAAAGARWADTAPWLRALASELTVRRFHSLRGMLLHWSLDEVPLDWAVAEMPLESAGRWTRALGADTAALAWAAGLSFEEACARRDGGTLIVEDLTLLAVLRGHRLPQGA